MPAPTFINPLLETDLDKYANRTDELLYELLYNIQNGGLGGGATPPAGADTQIQYNNAGAFGAALMYWDNVNNRLGVNKATPTAALSVKGNGSSNTGITFETSNLSAVKTSYLRDDGLFGLTDEDFTSTPSYSGRLLVKVGTNNRVALLGYLEITTDDASYSGIGIAVQGSNRTMHLITANLHNSGDTASISIKPATFNYDRTGANLSILNLQLPTHGLITRVDIYKQFHLNGMWPTIAVPATRYIGIDYNPSGIGNALNHYAAVFRVGGVGINLGANMPTSMLQVGGLLTYADNAAAVTAGLTAGAFYIRTGHGLDVVV